MTEEVSRRETKREAKQRKAQLERLVERNRRLRAMVVAAVDARDVEKLKRVVASAPFSRDEFSEAVRLLKRMHSERSHRKLEQSGEAAAAVAAHDTAGPEPDELSVRYFFSLDRSVG